MRSVGYRRIILILAVLGISIASLASQSFSLSLLGLNLERGSNAILGLKLGLDLQGGVHLVYQARGTKEITATFQEAPNIEEIRAVLEDQGKTEAVIQEGGDRTFTIRVNALRAEELDIEGNVFRRSDADLIREALATRVGPLERDGFCHAEGVDAALNGVQHAFHLLR